MQPDQPHPRIEYTCPGCERVFRSDPENIGREVRCPDCSTSFEIPAAVPAPPLEPIPRSRYATDLDDDPQEPGGLSPSPDRMSRVVSGGPTPSSRWTNRWAVLWGLALLIAIVVPQVYEPYDYSGTRGYRSEKAQKFETEFLWDTLGKSRSPAILMIGAWTVVLLGLFAVIGGASMSGKRLGAALFWSASAAFLLSLMAFPLWAQTDAYFYRSGSIGTLLLVMLCSLCAIAAGNHIRKSHPCWLVPRQMAGIGGIVLVAGMLLPLTDDSPMIGVLFREVPWEEAPAVMACCLAFVVYSVLAIVSFKPGPIHRLNTAMSILSRCILIGLPLAIIASVLIEDENPNLVLVFATTLKASLALYAHLALIALGLATMLGVAGDRRAAAHRASR